MIRDWILSWALKNCANWDKVLKLAIQNKLNAVTADDLLRIEDGKVFIGKTELTHEELSTLIAEAKSFDRSLLWSLMMGNLYWIANFKMMKEANVEDEMRNGRMMTLCIDTIEDFITKLKNLK